MTIRLMNLKVKFIYCFVNKWTNDYDLFPKMNSLKNTNSRIVYVDDFSSRDNLIILLTTVKTDGSWNFLCWIVKKYDLLKINKYKDVISPTFIAITFFLSSQIDFPTQQTFTVPPMKWTELIKIALGSG